MDSWILNFMNSFVMSIIIIIIIIRSHENCVGRNANYRINCYRYHYIIISLDNIIPFDLIIFEKHLSIVEFSLFLFIHDDDDDDGNDSNFRSDKSYLCVFFSFVKRQKNNAERSTNSWITFVVYFFFIQFHWEKK